VTPDAKIDLARFIIFAVFGPAQVLNDAKPDSGATRLCDYRIHKESHGSGDE
jgi:hypothetical protein